MVWGGQGKEEYGKGEKAPVVQYLFAFAFRPICYFQLILNSDGGTLIV